MFSFDESTRISVRFLHKVLRKDFFTKITFRKNAHADIYRYLDVNFVAFVFYPNTSSTINIAFKTDVPARVDKGKTVETPSVQETLDVLSVTV